LDVEGVISMDFSDNVYILQNYDKVAEQFINSNIKLEDIPTDTAIKLHGQLQRIFPGRNIEAFGVKETAKTWVDKYWKQLKPKALDGGGWEITIPGDKEPIKIDNPRQGSHNEEVVNLIQDRLEDLSNNVANDKGIYRTITDIRNAYERQGFYSPSSEYGVYLKE
jgi:hypothetical protein